MKTEGIRNRPKNFIGRCRRETKRHRSRRRLFAEPLEDRRLLAASVVENPFPFHNPLIATDVNGDFLTTPRDALQIINVLNDTGVRQLDPASGNGDGAFLDVSSDNQLTPLDALGVINHLNRGEGLGEIVAIRAEVQDTAGVPVTSGKLIAGEPYRLAMFTEDLRATPAGVFAAYADIGFNDPSLFMVGDRHPDAFQTPAQFFQFATFDGEYKGQKSAFPPFWSGIPGDVNNPPDLDGTDDDGLTFPNELDELGAFASLSELGGGEFEVLHLDITPTTRGQLDLLLNPADATGNGVLLFGANTTIPPDVIDYGTTVSYQIIQPINAEDDSFPATQGTLLEDSPTVALDVLANDFFGEGFSGTLSLDPGGLTQPANGTVAISGSVINYTPDADFFGTDTFMYTAVDGQGHSDTAMVTVEVTSVNDAPNALDDSPASIAEDSGAHVIDVLVNDDAGPANEDQTLTITAVTQGVGGSVSISNAGADVTYTPDADFFGTDTFTYTITDNGNLTDTATVTITVDNINDPPIAVDDAISGIQEDSATSTLGVLANDSAGPGNEDSIQGITIVGVGPTDNGGTAAISADSLSIDYTPAADFFGDETFTYTISDGEFPATATVVVTVDNINDPPIAMADTVFADEFSTGNIFDVLANDSPGAGPETEPLTIQGVTTPSAGGTVTIAGDGQSLIYSPDPSALGPFEETFEYTISDGQLTDTAMVTVNVEPVIRPRARDDRFDVQEDSALADNVFDVTANDLFNDGATKAPITIVTQPLHGTAEVFNDFFIRYAPSADYFGPDSVEYQIDDDFVGPDGASVPDVGELILTVQNVNDAPIGVDDSFSEIQEDSAGETFDVLFNDKAGPDNETEPIVVSAVTQAQHGTVTIINGGSSVRYVPVGDYFGPDSFSYTLSDGQLTAGANVSLTIDNVNDAPIAVNDSYPSIQEDSADNLLDVLQNDAAGPTNETEAIVVSGITPASHGTVAIGVNGANVLYTPDGDYFGPDTFTYTISDVGGLTSTATVNLTVNDVNDDPTAVSDQVLALKNFKDQPLDVVSNDLIAPDVNEQLTITGLGPNNLTTIATPHGTASVAAGGQSVIYTPDTDFESAQGGLDTLTYTISDGRGGSSVGSVEIEVVDAVPSDISGSIFMDVNNNGIRDPQEIALAGVEVMLTGMNIRGETVDRMVTSGTDGTFLFNSVLPGALNNTTGYTVAANTPEFTIDGLDRIGDDSVDSTYTPGSAGNDVFTGIELGLFGTQRAEMNYSFGERGLTGRYTSISQYLSSTRKGLAAATSLAGDNYWFTVMKGWDGVETAQVQLANDFTSATLTILDTQGQTHVRTISYRDYHVAGDRTTGQFIIYFNGSAQDLGFNLPGGLTYSDQNPNGAEGESMGDDLQAPETMTEAEMYAANVDAAFGDGQWS